MASTTLSHLFKLVRKNEGQLDVKTTNAFKVVTQNEFPEYLKKQKDYRTKKNVKDSPFPKDFCLFIDLLFGGIPNHAISLDLLNEKGENQEIKNLGRDVKKLKELETDLRQQLDRANSYMEWSRDLIGGGSNYSYDRGRKFDNSNKVDDITARDWGYSILSHFHGSKHKDPKMKQYILEFLKPENIMTLMELFPDFKSCEHIKNSQVAQSSNRILETHLEKTLREVELELEKLKDSSKSPSAAERQALTRTINENIEKCCTLIETFNTITCSMLPVKMSIISKGNEQEFNLVSARPFKKVEASIEKSITFAKGKSDIQVSYNLFSYFLINLLKFPYYYGNLKQMFEHQIMDDDSFLSSVPATSNVSGYSRIDSLIKQLKEENVYFQVIAEYLEYFLTPGRPGGSFQQQPNKEVFLTLLIGYWIDTSCVQRYAYQSTYVSTEFSKKAVMYLGKFLLKDTGERIVNNKKSITLTVNYCKKNNAYTFNLNATLCTLFVLHHVMSKITVKEWPDHVQQINKYVSDHKDLIMKHITSLQDKDRSEEHLLDYLPESIKRFQQPLYDKFRASFDDPKINQPGGFDVFRATVEVWLMYLQPWREAKEKFEAARWREYIAANYHFYTALLILFCNAISKLSPEKLGKDEILKFCLQVFEVFDDKICETIYEIHDACKNVLKMSRNESNSKLKPYFDAKDNSLSLCALVVAQHIHLHPDCYKNVDKSKDKGIGLRLVDIVDIKFLSDKNRDIEVAKFQGRPSENVLILLRRLMKLYKDPSTPNPGHNEEYPGEYTIYSIPIFQKVSKWVQMQFLNEKNPKDFFEPRSSSVSKDRGKYLRKNIDLIQRIFKFNENESSRRRDGFDDARDTKKDDYAVPTADYLQIPIQSHEIRWLSSFLIFTSLAANKYFHLPRNDVSEIRWSQMPWRGNVGLLYFWRWFRFNLRCFGDLKFLSRVGGLVFWAYYYYYNYFDKFYNKKHIIAVMFYLILHAIAYWIWYKCCHVVCTL